MKNAYRALLRTLDITQLRQIAAHAPESFLGSADAFLYFWHDGKG